jgi:hypothetical protein
VRLDRRWYRVKAQRSLAIIEVDTLSFPRPSRLKRSEGIGGLSFGDGRGFIEEKRQQLAN